MGSLQKGERTVDFFVVDVVACVWSSFCKGGAKRKLNFCLICQTKWDSGSFITTRLWRSVAKPAGVASARVGNGKAKLFFPGSKLLSDNYGNHHHCKLWNRKITLKVLPWKRNISAKKNRFKGLGHQWANLASKSYIGSLEQNESSSGLGL